MTDHPTPATPEATEREAREAVVAMVVDILAERRVPRGEVGRRLDAYRAAVAAVESERGRRAERERIAGIVEGMVGYHVRTEADEFYGRDGIETVDRAALLAKLREAK